MRYRKVIIAVVAIFLINSVVLFYLSHQWFWTYGIISKRRHSLMNDLTIVLYEYEYYENDVVSTTSSFTSQLPGVKVLVVSDERPYPPLDIQSHDIEEVYLNTFPEESVKRDLLNRPRTGQYLLIVPDAIRLKSVSGLERALSAFKKRKDVNVLVFHVEEHNKPYPGCQGLHFNTRQWTLQYSTETKVSQCRAFNGAVAILMRQMDFTDLKVSYIHPFFEAFFIQSVLKKWIVKVVVDQTPFSVGRKLFTTEHSKWKHGIHLRDWKKNMFKRFGIKKVITADNSVEYYGCRKETARCFGTIYNDIPEYIYQGRWTPPCCLEALRETANYVFKIFEDAGARYWLEGGSLLGAARNGDIIPWDYDVDIGMFESDIGKIEYLQKAASGERVVDHKGFLWEKAIDGDFVRIKYSQVNHLHVDIFPFFERNGVMTKRTWLKSHRQDTEFPAHYLNPLETISFVGSKVSCPNNVRKFLEYKFGPGVIENPQYPNPDQIKAKMGKSFVPSPSVS